MTTLDEYLKVKRSTIPGTGKGLFTKAFIPRGTIVTEYTGKVSTWNEANHDDGKNGYIYYVTRNYVIDAKDKKDSFAHFANDARGITKVKGIVNNAQYVQKGKRVFIETTKNIEAGEEIFVGYGKEYWDVIRENMAS